MDLTLPLCALAWLALMGGPVLTAAVAVRGAQTTHAPSVPIVLASMALLATVAVPATLHVQLAWPPANWLAVAAGWTAWCVLVGLLYAIRPRSVGIGVGALASLSVLPGLLLGTIGILGLMFIVGDYARPPLASRTLSPGIDCIVTGWGSAFSDDGHDIDIYRYWRWLPAIRRRVRHVAVDETRPDPATRFATCASVAGTLS